MGRVRHVIWPNQKNCIFVIVILSSILAAGIVQDRFAGEAGEGEHGRRSGDDCRGGFRGGSPSVTRAPLFWKAFNNS